mmetsp:Transcript_45379/g.95228  ORF Transcript_45379/g.95228 Transcript_45379/m.95228 type:complete len:981 (-) Transcript_45379:97-3039(-)
MPPKKHNMGSITHNSAEVNRGSSRRGMLTKIKGSFASQSSKSFGGGTKARTDAGLARSVQNTHATAPSKLKRRGSNSFTHGDSTVTDDFSSVHSKGVPTSITALVDAASVLSDEFDAPVSQPPPSHSQKRYHQDSFLPQSVQRRHSINYGQTTDSASRALVNLKISGGSQMDKGGMPRINSGEWGHSSGQDWGHNSGQEWGHDSRDWGQQQHNMVQVNDQAGYNNYTYDGYDGYEGYDGYDGYEGYDNGEAYYDDAGGGIFDESYMRSSSNSRSRASHQQESAYTRRTSSDPYYRRASDGSFGVAELVRSNGMHQSYRNSPDGGGDNDPRNMSSHTTLTHNNMDYGGSDPRMSYASQSMSQPLETKRNSIDNSAIAPRRRASVEFDPRKIGGVEFDPRKSTSNHSEFDPRMSQRSTGLNSVGHLSTKSKNNIVNNTGRDASNATTQASRAKSPSSHSTSKSSSMKMSQSGKQNPSWFTEQHSDSTDQVNNNNDNNENQLRTSRRYQDADDDRTMTTMLTKDQALRPSAMIKAKDMSSPQGDVTIVYTDVRGSTSFWETCPTDMKKATDIHDIIMRQCYTNHSGYEITTEGDSFNLAFQHPVDALAFALQAQLKLYKADWPDGILKHPDGKDEPALKFRGFRVRFGIHHGPTKSRVHEMTGRTLYSGEGVKIAKAVEGMCHGGQILTTMETWKAVSGMAERYLGRPQILDCGEHLLFETNIENGVGGFTTTRYSRRIMQVVPRDLAFDFFEARGRKDVTTPDGKMVYEIKDASAVKGRLFPPVISKRQLTTSFLNAPYMNGRVTICFVYTVGLEESNPATKQRNLGVLAKYVRKQMLTLNPPGYECQEDNGCWMLAFDRMVNAVFFGLQMKNNMQGVGNLFGNVNRENMFKVGIVSGPYTSMGPHRTTGMADYFGPIVNRAARVCSNSEPGQVCIGVPLAPGVTADPPDFGSSVAVHYLGVKKLKGISIDVAIFGCSMKRR